MELVVKYIGVGTLEGNKIIASYFPEKSIKKSVEKEIENLLSSSNRDEWVKKTLSPMGMWFLQSDSHNLIYLSLVKNGYPESFASALLNDLKSLFSTQNLNNLKSLPSESYTSVMASDMEKLHKKYSNTSSLDKIQNANAKVMEVKSLASVGIQQVMRNIESAELISEKSSQLEASSEMFKQDAKRLKRIALIRKMKITCIIIIVVTVILLCIILPILLISSKN